MKSILDPSFRYTKSIETDLRKTFARIRREMRKQEQQQVTAGVEAKERSYPFIRGRSCRAPRARPWIQVAERSAIESPRARYRANATARERSVSAHAFTMRPTLGPLR